MSAPETLPASGHEQRDVRVGSVLRWSVGLLGLILFTGVAMWFLVTGLRSHEEHTSPSASPLAGSYGPTEPPAPRLQTDPREDLARQRAREQAQLDGYGWIDRSAGTVHIPVERAMELLVQRRGGTP
jgi:hypothetical protein